jgi:hypothetical protein
MGAFLLDVILHKNDPFRSKLVSFLLLDPFTRLAGFDKHTTLNKHKNLSKSSDVMKPLCFYSVDPGGYGRIFSVL